MKKVLFALLCAVALLGCNKTEKEDQNPYAGTTWIKSYHSSFSGDDYMYVLEFTKTDFSYYEADINGNYKSGMTQGAYTFNGDEITINNVRDKSSILEQYLTGASVSGNMITLHGYWISSEGTRHDEPSLRTMAKKNN